MVIVGNMVGLIGLAMVFCGAAAHTAEGLNLIHARIWGGGNVRSSLRRQRRAGIVVLAGVGGIIFAALSCAI